LNQQADLAVHFQLMKDGYNLHPFIESLTPYQRQVMSYYWSLNKEELAELVPALIRRGATMPDFAFVDPSFIFMHDATRMYFYSAGVNVRTAPRPDFVSFSSLKDNSAQLIGAMAKEGKRARPNQGVRLQCETFYARGGGSAVVKDRIVVDGNEHGDIISRSSESIELARRSF
jgi:hypothetical protein